MITCTDTNLAFGPTFSTFSEDIRRPKAGHSFKIDQNQMYIPASNSLPLSLLPPLVVLLPDPFFERFSAFHGTSLPMASLTSTSVSSVQLSPEAENDEEESARGPADVRGGGGGICLDGRRSNNPCALVDDPNSRWESSEAERPCMRFGGSNGRIEVGNGEGDEEEVRRYRMGRAVLLEGGVEDMYDGEAYVSRIVTLYHRGRAIQSGAR